MFSHVFVSASDFERALAFYSPLMDALGIMARFCEYTRPWAGGQSKPDIRPLFIIGKPFDGKLHEPGNGQMIAFLVPDRETVDRALQWRWPMVDFPRVHRASGLSTTKTTMARTSAIPTATSLAWPVRGLPPGSKLNALSSSHNDA